MPKLIGNTKKKYTLILQCCDPPVRAFFTHTDNKKRAKKLYDYLVQEEKNKRGGGEFSIHLFEHKTPYPKVKNMITEENGEEFVYNINYPDSEQLDSFSYMDLFVYE